MTAPAEPVWLASPPEVWSTLLSSGPGPGPMQAAAAAWSTLATEYVQSGEELTALLGEVQASAWQGPSAAAYASAHTPYLGWLMQEATASVTAATQLQAAAGSYSAALGAMPTLAELAANHAAHAALVATNFFGINTIPIALNEADYVRMWIQAATVMGTYRAVAGSATVSAAASQAASSPRIRAAEDQPQQLITKTEVSDFLDKIGYTDFYNKYISSLNNPLFPNIFNPTSISQVDPFLIPLEGNPLFYINPLFIAQAIGEPIDIGTFITFQIGNLAHAGTNIGLALATGNPLTLFGVIALELVQIGGLAIINTLELLHQLLQQTLTLIPALLPMISAIPAATMAPLPGLSGLAGLAAIPAVPPLVATPMVPPVPLAVMASTPPVPAPVPAPPPAAPPAPAAAAPPPAAGPAPPPAPPPMGTLNAFGYLVAGMGADARSPARASAKTRRKAPAPKTADVEAPAAASAVQKTKKRRSRWAKATQPGRRYEYIDLDSPDSAVDSVHGGGSSGFFGAEGKDANAAPAGLVGSTIYPGGVDAGDSPGAAAYGATAPLIPTTWHPDVQ